MRRAIRDRKIDLDRPMPVYRSEKEMREANERDDYDDRPGRRRRRHADSDDEDHPVAIDIPVPEPIKKADFIPIPRLDIDAKYDETLIKMRGHFRFGGNTYIRMKDAKEEDIYMVEYDLDDADEEWLATFNKERTQALGDDKFEEMMNRLEKETKDAKEPPPLSDVEKMLRDVPRNVTGAVYNYWCEKRKKIGLPLNRRYHAPPSVNDPSPNVVFRPREKEKTRKQTRRNDQASYNKMAALRTEMERVRTLLELIKKREKLKKDLLSVSCNLFQAHRKYERRMEVNRTDPTYCFDRDLLERSGDGKKIKIKRKHDDMGKSDAGPALASAVAPAAASSSVASAGLPLKKKIKFPEDDESDSGSCSSALFESEELAMLETADQLMGVSLPPPTIVRSRPRIGRGGRVIYDRVRVPANHAEKQAFQFNYAIGNSSKSKIQSGFSTLFPSKGLASGGAGEDQHGGGGGLAGAVITGTSSHLAGGLGGISSHMKAEPVR